MSKISFTLEVDVDGEPGPDMAVDLHEAVLKSLHRSSVREGCGLGRSDGIDRISISKILLQFDDPEAFSPYERREYAAGAALVTEACREIIFFGYDDDVWAHTANGASRRFYGLIGREPTLLEAQIGFFPNSDEVDSIRILAPDRSIRFERKSAIVPEEEGPSPG